MIVPSEDYRTLKITGCGIKDQDLDNFLRIWNESSSCKYKLEYNEVAASFKASKCLRRFEISNRHEVVDENCSMGRVSASVTTVMECLVPPRVDQPTDDTMAVGGPAPAQWHPYVLSIAHHMCDDENGEPARCCDHVKQTIIKDKHLWEISWGNHNAVAIEEPIQLIPLVDGEGDSMHLLHMDYSLPGPRQRHDSFFRDISLIQDSNRHLMQLIQG